MATDPIQNIKTELYDSPLSFGVQEALKRLAALPASTDVPYLTLSLDWRPQGEHPGWDLPEEQLKSQRRTDEPQDEDFNRRPSWRTLERELDDLIEQHGPRGDVFDSLSADKERIEAWLDDELDPSAQGVFMVACGAQDVFEPLALSLPVETRLDHGPTPRLSVVARMVDDNPPYAVLLADQKDATLTIVRRAQVGRQVQLEGSGYPRKQAQGGWSQRRYQARADERIDAFAREVAEQARAMLRESDVHALIIAGDEVITSALDDVMHSEVSDAVIGRVRLEITTSDSELIDATLPVAEEAERNRELQVAKDVTGAVGAGVKGAAGAADVLTALQAGQVMTLVMVDDFAGAGWADFAMDAYGTGDVPTSHPMGGDTKDLSPVALEDGILLLAVRTDAEIDIIKSAVPMRETGKDVADAGEGIPRPEAARLVDELGGVAALLRFDLDSAAETSGQPDRS